MINKIERDKRLTCWRTQRVNVRRLRNCNSRIPRRRSKLDIDRRRGHLRCLTNISRHLHVWKRIRVAIYIGRIFRILCIVVVIGWGRDVRDIRYHLRSLLGHQLRRQIRTVSRTEALKLLRVLLVRQRERLDSQVIVGGVVLGCQQRGRVVLHAVKGFMLRHVRRRRNGRDVRHLRRRTTMALKRRAAHHRLPVGIGVPRGQERSGGRIQRCMA